MYFCATEEGKYIDIFPEMTSEGTKPNDTVDDDDSFQNDCRKFGKTNHFSQLIVQSVLEGKTIEIFSTGKDHGERLYELSIRALEQQLVGRSEEFNVAKTRIVLHVTESHDANKEMDYIFGELNASLV